MHDDDGDVTAFRDSARALLADLAKPARLRAHRQKSPGFDRHVWQALADAGWTALLVPETLGGLGRGLPELAAIAEEIGRRLLPEPFIAGAVQTTALLSRLPASPRRDALLAGIMAGATLAGVAWQERAGQLAGATGADRGDGDAAMTATRRRDNGALTLTGRLRWLAPGAGADGWLVVAGGGSNGAEPRTPALWWVPADSEGVSIQSIERIDGSPMAELELQEVRLQADACLASGEPLATALAAANDVARIAQAAELLGVAREAFVRTLDYQKTRVQFGRPIGANQALQHRLVDGFIGIEIAAAGLAEVVSQPGGDAATLAWQASRAKARCAALALEVTRQSIQLHGAIGFTDAFDLGLYWKRAAHLAGWLGGAAAHRDRLLSLQLARERAVGTTAAATDDDPADLLPPGTDWAALPEPRFRRAVRAFLHAHYPPALRHPPRRLHWDDAKDWYLTLSRQGWLAPAWPKEHGGMGLPPDLLLAFIDEFEDFGVARTPDQGLINLGPVLIRYGTDAQRREWLPPILSGDHVWCQGYSEPGAGSDLASLRTEAIVDGDDFVVSGQKIWTTLAQDANHIFLLVRTDKTAKKQEGISFLLVDLTSPGIVVRPIRNIAGDEEFCEVFFDRVRVPQRNLVGAINQGWTIAKALLGHERLFVGSPKTCQHALGQLRQLAEARGRFTDAAFRQTYATLLLDLLDLRAAYAGFADIVKRGEALPPSVSLLKVFATETFTRIAATLVEAADEDGASRPRDADDPTPDLIAPLLFATITTIYGGTNEIQRNILARGVLGLP